MKITDIIANTIDRLPTDHVFTYADFNVDVSKNDAVVKALNRMVTSGKISKLSKGKFYKPRQSRFGPLKPSAYQIAKDFLEQDGEIIGYITGYNAYNEMGLTTQIPSALQIGTNKPRRAVMRGMYNISFIVQPNKITKSNIELLRILDAMRFVREIPGTTPDDACTLIISIVGQLTQEQTKTLAKLVLQYSPVVRALCGAIFEHLDIGEDLIKKIANSLNPVTEYKVPVSVSVLPNKTKWRIK